MDALCSLPGVGRKTANVVRSVAFGEPGLPVDTHVTRLSHRLDLSRGKDPVAIERSLCRSLDPERWGAFSVRLILHGRRDVHGAAPELRGVRARGPLPAARCRSSSLSDASSVSRRDRRAEPSQRRCSRSVEASPRSTATSSRRSSRRRRVLGSLDERGHAGEQRRRARR